MSEAAANFDTMYGALWPVVVTPASDDVLMMWMSASPGWFGACSCSSSPYQRSASKSPSSMMLVTPLESGEMMP